MKKPFALLAGRPVWWYSASLFADREEVRQLVIILAPEDRSFFEAHYAEELRTLRTMTRVDLADGGSERSDSVRNGLAILRPETTMIAVHDAARPCMTSQVIDAVFAEAERVGAALPAAPVVATLKRSRPPATSPTPVIAETVSRDDLWEAQTPQVFRRDLLLAAYEKANAGEKATDDCALLERLGEPVVLVPSDRMNLKITTPADLLLAEMIIATQNKNAASAQRNE